MSVSSQWKIPGCTDSAIVYDGDNAMYRTRDQLNKGDTDDVTKNVPTPGDHVFQATGTIFEVQDIIGTNLLTKFHDDRTINMASTVLTRKNATPPWRPYIINTNLVTKFHEDWTINVPSRELTRQMLMPHNEQRTTDKRRSQKLTMSTLCSGELKNRANKKSFTIL
ncbi:hypothetical protein DPMN_040445 [Dreissena polymorpha]|uniref:Uncharacterized protein n=1 Tax=Dreissena polymorpha TaxID=45954 RepID=A0A9D4HWW4_DREPO|nr:hypothetical protein DPMN_040445 [Dreissena polymorpha]